MSDSEAGTIFSALAEGVRTHDQVVEVSDLIIRTNASFSCCCLCTGAGSCQLPTAFFTDGQEYERTR